MKNTENAEKKQSSNKLNCSLLIQTETRVPTLGSIHVNI